jgi:hypothetical protein
MAVGYAQEAQVAPDGKPFSLLVQTSEQGNISYEFGVRFSSLESAKETVNALIQLGHIFGAVVMEDKAHLYRKPRPVI